MATLKTLYRQFEESSNFNKTYLIPLSLLNECKLDLGGDLFHEYVGNNVDLSGLEGL